MVKQDNPAPTSAFRLLCAFAAATAVATASTVAVAAPAYAAGPEANRVSAEWTDSVTGSRFRVQGAVDVAYSPGTVIETLRFNNAELSSTQISGRRNASQSSVQALVTVTSRGFTDIDPRTGWKETDDGCAFPTANRQIVNGKKISMSWDGNVCKIKAWGWISAHRIWVEGGHLATPSHWSFGTAVS